MKKTKKTPTPTTAATPSSVNISNVSINNDFHHDPRAIEALIECAKAVRAGNEALQKGMQALSLEGLRVGPGIAVNWPESGK